MWPTLFFEIIVAVIFSLMVTWYINNIFYVSQDDKFSFFQILFPKAWQMLVLSWQIQDFCSTHMATFKIASYCHFCCKTWQLLEPWQILFLHHGNFGMYCIIFVLGKYDHHGNCFFFCNDIPNTKLHGKFNFHVTFFSIYYMANLVFVHHFRYFRNDIFLNKFWWQIYHLSLWQIYCIHYGFF